MSNAFQYHMNMPFSLKEHATKNNSSFSIKKNITRWSLVKITTRLSIEYNK